MHDSLQEEEEEGGKWVPSCPRLGRHLILDGGEGGKKGGCAEQTSPGLRKVPKKRDWRNTPTRRADLRQMKPRVGTGEEEGGGSPGPPSL